MQLKTRTSKKSTHVRNLTKSNKKVVDTRDTMIISDKTQI